MRLMKWLLAFPLMLINFFWRLIWSLFRTVIIIGLVVFALSVYADHSNSQLANTISTIREQVMLAWQGDSVGQLTQNLEQLATDDVTIYEGVRWPEAEATVYIASSDAQLVSAYETAIANWNATGVFTFTIVSDPAEADIVARDYSDAQTEAAGLEETTINQVTHELEAVTVSLNRYYLIDNNFGYDQERIVHTAEHELGHAIGLNHDDQEESVMQSAGSYYGIQSVDIETVRQLYAK